MTSEPDLTDIALRVHRALDEEPFRPICLHRISEEFLDNGSSGNRDGLLERARSAADELVGRGLARKESVSAIGIGVHCEDSMYWSARSDHHQLAEFGPEYEAPTILHRLASHIQCHGL